MRLNEIKARAPTFEESISTILHSFLRRFPLNTTSELSRNEILMQTSRRQRKTPATTSINGLPDDSRKNYRGEDFLFRNQLVFL